MTRYIPRIRWPRHTGLMAWWHRNTIRNLVQTADALRDARDPAAAAPAYRAALALAPRRNGIRIQLANMLKDTGQFAEAEATYRAALAHADQADTHLQLGHVLKMTGRRDQAIAEYRNALARDPANAAAVQELAEAGIPAMQQRRFDTQLRAGGIEALLTLTHAIAALRADLDTLTRALPEAQARTAVPIGCYAIFRDAFPIPPPPTANPDFTPHILLAEPEDLPTLFAQIAAIQAQSHPTWRLSVLGQTPGLHMTDGHRVADLAATADPRITWISPTPASTPAQAEHIQASASPEPWLILLAPGAILDPQALAWFAAAAAWTTAPAFICDEETGTRHPGHVARTNPQLRQRVDPDTLREANVFGETIAVRTEAYRAAPLPGATLSADRTTLLQTLADTAPVGHIPYPLAWRTNPTPPTNPTPEPVPIPEPIPIAIIIATRDNAADLETMLDSLRTTADTPAALEIRIIDNGTTRPADRAILDRLAATPGTPGTPMILRRDEPFNWSHLNNQAARTTEAPILLFANDDMRMLTPGWDTTLRTLLARPGVAALGARLLYPDDTIQHAGILFGWKGSVIHDGLHEPAEAPGPARRWQVTRAVGAVTGAFLATTRHHFEAQGGFDAQFLPVAYSDVDYALKLRRAGLKVLWTPAITLHHHESKSRSLDHTDPWRTARNAQERATMEQRWGDAMAIDPGIHPAWHAATLPFRLLAAPSADRVRDHIIRTASPQPWRI